MAVPSPVSRRAALRVGAAAAGVVLAGCAPPRPALRIGSIVFPGYEPMFVAREAGRLDPRRVRLVEMRSGTGTQQALAVRQLEGAALTLDEVLVARAEGLDLRVVAVLDQSAGADAVLARPPLRLPRDLAGRRVGVEAGAVGGVMLDAVLQAAGLGAMDIVKVPITQATALQLWDERRLDAVVTAEPWVGALEQKGAVRVFDSAAIPGRIVDVLAVRADRLDAQAEEVRLLVAAHYDGLRLMRADADRSAAVMAARLHLPAAEVAAAFRGLTLPDAAAALAMMTDGTLLQSLETLRRVMLSQGLLPRDPGPVSRVLDAAFLPAPHR